MKSQQIDGRDFAPCISRPLFDDPEILGLSCLNKAVCSFALGSRVPIFNPEGKIRRKIQGVDNRVPNLQSDSLSPWQPRRAGQAMIAPRRRAGEGQPAVPRKPFRTFICTEAKGQFGVPTIAPHKKKKKRHSKATEASLGIQFPAQKATKVEIIFQYTHNATNGSTQFAAASKKVHFWVRISTRAFRRRGSHIRRLPCVGFLLATFQKT